MLAESSAWSLTVLTLKVTRVRDDGGAGRFQLVERGRHDVIMLCVWEMSQRGEDATTMFPPYE